MNARWLIIITVLYWKLVWVAERKYWCPIISKFARPGFYLAEYLTLLFFKNKFLINVDELLVPLRTHNFYQKTPTQITNTKCKKLQTRCLWQWSWYCLMQFWTTNSTSQSKEYSNKTPNFVVFKILQIPNTKCNAVLHLKQQQQRIRKCNAKRSGKGDTAQIGFNTMKISLKISLKIFLEISLKISKQLLHNYITNSTYDGTFLNLPYISYIVVVFGCDFCKWGEKGKSHKGEWSDR